MSAILEQILEQVQRAQSLNYDENSITEAHDRIDIIANALAILIAEALRLERLAKR